jgi:hypothetical protein
MIGNATKQFFPILYKLTVQEITQLTFECYGKLWLCAITNTQSCDGVFLNLCQTFTLTGNM